MDNEGIITKEDMVAADVLLGDATELPKTRIELKAHIACALQAGREYGEKKARAELTAPAGGDDREAAEKLLDELNATLITHCKIGLIRDALYIARQAERAEGEAIKAAELEFVRMTGLLVADYATMGKATPERQEQYILARDALVTLLAGEEVGGGE